MVYIICNNIVLVDDSKVGINYFIRLWREDYDLGVLNKWSVKLVVEDREVISKHCR